MGKFTQEDPPPSGNLQIKRRNEQNSTFTGTVVLLSTQYFNRSADLACPLHESGDYTSADSSGAHSVGVSKVVSSRNMAGEETASSAEGYTSQWEAIQFKLSEYHWALQVSVGDWNE